MLDGRIRGLVQGNAVRRLRLLETVRKVHYALRELLARVAESQALFAAALATKQSAPGCVFQWLPKHIARPMLLEPRRRACKVHFLTITY